MQGYELTFYTVQNRKHGHQTLCEWLMQEAKNLGVGATLISAIQGIDRNRQIHSSGFIDLADQPMLVKMVLSASEMEVLLSKIQSEKIALFYTRQPVEWGYTGQ